MWDGVVERVMRRRVSEGKRSMEVVVRGICLRGGRVLVCRSKAHGHAFFPGGHLEFGERAREALEREWREELGVEGKAGRFLGVAEGVYDAVGGVKTHELSIVFRVRCAALKPSAAFEGEEGHLRFEWVRLGRLGAAGVLPGPLVGAVGKWLRGQGGGFA